MALPVSGKLKSGKGMTALEKLLLLYRQTVLFVPISTLERVLEINTINSALKKQKKKRKTSRLVQRGRFELVQHDTSRDRDLFYVYVPLGLYNEHAKSFDWVDLNNISLEWCQKFIEELGYWDKQCYLSR